MNRTDLIIGLIGIATIIWSTVQVTIALFATWETATYWSTYASKIVAV